MSDPRTNRATSRRPHISSRREALPKGMRSSVAFTPAFGRGGDPWGLILSVVVAAAIAGSGLFHVWTRSEHLRLGYVLVAAEARVRAAESEGSRLKVEEARLASPLRIAKLAEQRLGLKAPSREQIVEVGAETGTEDAVATALARR